MNIPAHNPYDVLKETIPRPIKVSEEKRIQLLLSWIQLGNLRPSQLLRQTRALVDNTTLDDSVSRQIWLQWLPPYVQSILNVFAHVHSPEQLAECADRTVEQVQRFQSPMANIESPKPSIIQQTLPNPTPGKLLYKPTTEVQLLSQQLADLRLAMATMQTIINNLQTTRTTSSRSRSINGRRRTPSLAVRATTTDFWKSS
ncbi:unnamed protein product [Echinostoma caproni]|uniref:Uncharacterized protein n=1 Tax=Echinostoma caproni TaxID=27848 RepID=A0A183AS86_9TREM|nr:unnamed protein product [Echinostoma caproni]